MAEVLNCPFCDFTDTDSYFLILHVEQVHTDDSPFKITEPPDLPPGPVATQEATAGPFSHDSNAASSSSAEEWVLCPEKDCDEQVHLAELNEHLDLHLAEGLTESGHSSRHGKMRSSIASAHSFNADNFSTDLPDQLRHSSPHHKTRPRSDSEKTTLTRSILDILSPTAGSRGKSRHGKSHVPRHSARLGKSELGPYAYEDRMPSWLYEQLKAGGKKTTINRIGRDGRLIKHEVIDNETPSILPVLVQLCALEPSVQQAYICNPATLQIGKQPREGSFCGYRNIQMLVSYMQGAKAQGHDRFPPGTPNILKLQDWIEEAWDKGINEPARIQTGGIRGTRKYIGTPEVEALLRSLNIDHGIQMFTDRPNNQAYEQLLTDIEGYFRSGVPDDAARTKVYKTNLPPVYLQQPGHSLTIVGLEIHRDGSRNLLVFDPFFKPPPAMMRILGRRDLRTPRPEVLQAYRRGARQLRRHRDFEMIKLTAHLPLFPVWDVLSRFSDYPYVYVFYNGPTGMYDVVPEDEFTHLFPWQMYGGLLSTDDARFATGGDWCSYSICRCGLFDTGLLGGLPELQDREYLTWLKRQPLEMEDDDGSYADRTSHKRKRRDSVLDNDGDRGQGNEFTGGNSRKRLETPTPVNNNSAVSSAFTRFGGGLDHNNNNDTTIEDIPEDCFFMKSVDDPVPMHYACGMPLKPGWRHVNYGRCTASSPLTTSRTSASASASTSYTPDPRLTSSPTKPYLSCPLMSTSTSSPPYTCVHDSTGTVWLDLGAVDHNNCNYNSHSNSGRPGRASRETTPVHELRDFFYERDSESSTPIFYGTGTGTMSPGWAIRMEMEG